MFKCSSLLDKLGISSARQLDKIRDKTVEELKDYCLKDNNNSSSTQPNEDSNEKTISSISHHHPGLTRFSDLLLRLSPLRSLQPDVLEELFFAGLIGNVQIDSVVPYILKMEASEYQTSPFVKGTFFKENYNLNIREYFHFDIKTSLLRV